MPPSGNAAVKASAHGAWRTTPGKSAPLILPADDATTRTATTRQFTRILQRWARKIEVVS
jgi:hypothetical protein